MVRVRGTASAGPCKGGGLCAGACVGYGRDPSGRLRRHLRRPFQLRRPHEKAGNIKRPHCGAFAVIRLCSYFLAYFALCTCVRFTPRAGALWTLALVLERALSGYAVAAFPMAKNTGLAHTFATAADKTVVRRVLAVLAAVLCMGMAALGGWALVLAALAVLWRYHAVSRKQFGGITGDLAGWFLQKAELWMLAALCACQWGGLL